MEGGHCSLDAILLEQQQQVVAGRRKRAGSSEGAEVVHNSTHHVPAAPAAPQPRCSPPLLPAHLRGMLALWKYRSYGRAPLSRGISVTVTVKFHLWNVDIPVKISSLSALCLLHFEICYCNRPAPR